MAVMRRVVVYLTLVVLHGVVSQVFNRGKCPEIGVKHHFDLKQYMGVWYQHATFGTALFQGVGKCATARYTYNTTARHVNVFNSQVPLSTGGRSSIEGTAIPQETDKKEGKLLVTFKLPVIGSLTSPYWVLDTDYTSWALVYSCVDLQIAHITSGWILTRIQDLESSSDVDAINAQVNQALNNAHLIRSMFMNTTQNDCNVNTEHEPVL